MTKKIGSFGQYGLHIIEFPSGKYGYVGTLPEVLTVTKKPENKLPYVVSRTFDTAGEAEQFFEDNKNKI